MNKRMRDNKFYTFLTKLLFLCCAIIFIYDTPCIFADLSVSVSGPTWEIGKIKAQGTAQTLDDNWTITGPNDGYETVQIRVASTGDWSAWESAGSPGPSDLNKFVLRDNQTSSLIKSTDTNFLTLFCCQPYDLGLWFQAPVLGSEDGPHQLTVTLTASNYHQCGVCSYAENGYGCRFKDYGEQGLPACQYCSGTSEDASYVPIDGTDTLGEHLCSGLCRYCNGAGSCWGMSWSTYIDRRSVYLEYPSPTRSCRPSVVSQYGYQYSLSTPSCYTVLRKEDPGSGHQYLYYRFQCLRQ